MLLTALLVVCYALPAGSAEMVSNLGESVDDSYGVDYDGPEAQGFTTDGGSYFLESVTVHIVTVDDASGNFTLRIFTDNGGVPGTMVANGALSGPGNPSVGLNTYTATGNVALAPNTTYWVVAQVSSGNGYYDWSTTDSTSETGVWTIEDNEAYSEDAGATWDTDVGVLRMSVSASTQAASIPTLGTWGMLLLVALITGIALQMIRRRQAVAV